MRVRPSRRIQTSRCRDIATSACLASTPFWQDTIIGSAIIFAVLFERVRSSRQSEQAAGTSCHGSVRPADGGLMTPACILLH